MEQKEHIFSHSYPGILDVAAYRVSEAETRCTIIDPELRAGLGTCFGANAMENVFANAGLQDLLLLGTRLTE